MGVDTGAYKKMWVENGEIRVTEDYDDVENDFLAYPNGEFIKLAYTISDLTNKEISFVECLILDDEYPEDELERVKEQIEKMDFNKTLDVLNRAKGYILENKESVTEDYRYGENALDVINYLIMLTTKKYYVFYNY